MTKITLLVPPAAAAKINEDPESFWKFMKAEGFELVSVQGKDPENFIEENWALIDSLPIMTGDAEFKES
jgi:hypothetical protein